MANDNDVRVACQVGGLPFPLTAYTVDSGVKGSGGHCNIWTTPEALAAGKVDLLALSEQAPQSLPVDIFLTIGSDRYHLFGGEYVKAQWNYDLGEIEIHCRDWTSVLMDEKRVLTKGSGVETQNQTLDQMVTSVAKDYGLKPKITVSSNGNPVLGAQFGSSDRTYWTQPQTAWSTLTRLARENGYEVHVTPDKELVFNTAGEGDTIQLCYGVSPPIPNGVIPCWGLQIEHNPKRNKSFQVKVKSYDPTTAQLTSGESVVVGDDIDGNGETINAGAWSGSKAQQVDDALGSTTGAGTSRVGKIPVYSFRTDGLTADQAQARADAIAGDIAKRQFILSASVLSAPTIQGGQILRISGPTIHPVFAANPFFVDSFTHTMKMTEGKDHNAEFSTKIKALDTPDAGKGNPVTKGKTRQSGRLGKDKGFIQ